MQLFGGGERLCGVFVCLAISSFNSRPCQVFSARTEHRKPPKESTWSSSWHEKRPETSAETQSSWRLRSLGEGIPASDSIVYDCRLGHSSLRTGRRAFLKKKDTCAQSACSLEVLAAFLALEQGALLPPTRPVAS